MSEAVVFAGTTEGRQISDYLADRGVDVCMCVATEYGKEIAGERENVHIHMGHMDAAAMTELIRSCSFVVDATHPYAYEVTKNILLSCEDAGKPYYRLLRPAGNTAGQIVVDSAKQVAEYLQDKAGNVLLTTGSKDLMDYKALDVTRLFPRVLPMQESLNQCTVLGVPQENIFCIQGPFSEIMNRAMLSQIKAKYLVTKDSGEAGGYREKLDAARKEGVTVIVIGRASEEEGYTMRQLKDILERRYGK